MDKADEYGKTPLYRAVEGGHKEVTELLIDHGADPNVDDGHGRTPLHLAQMNFRIEVITLLIENGAV